MSTDLRQIDPAALAALDLDGRRIAVESSANLRSCNMAELTTVTADAGLTKFHHAWIDELFRKAKT